MTTALQTAKAISQQMVQKPEESNHTVFSKTRLKVIDKNPQFQKTCKNSALAPYCQNLRRNIFLGRLEILLLCLLELLHSAFSQAIRIVLVLRTSQNGLRKHCGAEIKIGSPLAASATRSQI